jgi:hypothetical protein
MTPTLKSISKAINRAYDVGRGYVSEKWHVELDGHHGLVLYHDYHPRATIVGVGSDSFISVESGLTSDEQGVARLFFEAERQPADHIETAFRDGYWSKHMSGRT